MSWESDEINKTLTALVGVDIDHKINTQTPNFECFRFNQSVGLAWPTDVNQLHSLLNGVLQIGVLMGRAHQPHLNGEIRGKNILNYLW